MFHEYPNQISQTPTHVYMHKGSGTQTEQVINILCLHF